MEPQKQYPDSFYCPLTTEIMKDPVMDPEGNSYEREAIVAWLEKNSISPISRNPLTINDLIPNRALKESIDTILHNKDDQSDANLAAMKDSNVAKPEKPPGLNVDLQLDITSNNGSSMVSIKPPTNIKGINRTPATVCCVIDVSGSMSDEAKIQTDVGKNEGFGLSILDLVKHAVRTIISSLGDNDRLALVSFTTQAKTVMELTKMNQDGKKKAEKALEAMKPEDSTNIWDGLFQGLEVLRKGGAGKNSAILLLTDGQPNVIPPRGHIPMLQKYKDEHGLPGVINTFGFGYNLDSKLLNELATNGNGAYAFIPDGSFVGTIFVNSISNLLSTAATNVCLSIELNQNQTPDYSLIKNYSHQVTSWGLELQLGSVIFGQPKQVVLPMTFDGSRKLSVTLRYETPYDDQPIKFAQEIDVQEVKDPEIEVQKFRLSFVNEVLAAVELMNNNSGEAMTGVKNLIADMKSSSVAGAKFVKDMLADLEDQTTMALTKKENFTKWGRHFLPSLARAHLLQQCNNFKDPGVQNYGGEVFNKIRDKIDETFIKIPPPKPSVKKAVPQPKIQNMAAFYNPQGGCIDGSCLVKMANGANKFVRDITKNDQVMGSNGKAVKVVCVVKTVYKSQKAQMVQFESGLRITPWHPVRINGKFYFPCQVEEQFQYETFDCPAVYNFVLENHHLMTINGIECVTLGHGFQEEVVRHEYYGTLAVIEDLKKMEGWNNGLVVLQSDDAKRDPKTGMVTGMTKTKALQNEQVSESILV